MTEKPHHVWVPRRYFSKAKIKDDDVQMVPVEELEAVQNDKLKAINLSILTARQKLYDCLPTGKIDSFELIKVIQAHIKELDEILGVEE